MGVIYLAHDPDIGRPVAIKLVRADLLDGVDHEQYLVRFRAEARNAGRCMHPNVVAIYDFALHDGNPYLAMEYVDGVALSETLKRVGRFTPADAVALILQVLSALAAAHQLGIVHRDVKPANILVMPGGHVKMTDFGISRINTSNMTMDGAVIGTPAYMSPEQCRGETVDHRSDLFSAGTVLYELLSGARAFSGRSASEVSYRLLAEDPPDIAAHVQGVPDSLAAALRHAMEKRREARPASAQEMAEGLREAMRNAGKAGATDDRTVLNPLRKPARAAGEILDLSHFRTLDPLASHSPDPGEHVPPGGASNRPAGPSANLPPGAATTAPAAGSANLPFGTSGKVPFGGSGKVPSGSSANVPSDSSANVPSGSSANVPFDSSANVPFDSSAHFSFDDFSLSTIEQGLTRHLGPIARHMVRSAARQSTSVEGLCAKLAQAIDNPSERQRFLREMRGVSAGAATPAARDPATGHRTGSGTVPGTVPPMAISSDQIDRAEQALTRQIGPIARLMVKRALPGAGSVEELWELLARHIERPEDRQAFLRLRRPA